MAVKITRATVGAPPKGIVRPRPKRRKAKPEPIEDIPGYWQGHPHEVWIGRAVKVCKLGQAGKARPPARIKGFATDGSIILQPTNHSHPETIEAAHVHPWWAKNPDLKPTI